MTLAQKVDRVSRLLLGLRRRPVAMALAAHGFGAADIEEAFAHLRALTVTDLRGVGATSDAPSNRERVAAWAKKWQPILEPALVRRHPELARHFFPHFPRESEIRDRSYGIAQFFLMQFDKCVDDKDNADAREALALIARKGLDAAGIAELREMLSFEAGPSVAWPGVDFTEAEERLWAWYVEWSAVVRARVHDKRIRRELGISDTHADEESAASEEAG